MTQLQHIKEVLKDTLGSDYNIVKLNHRPFATEYALVNDIVGTIALFKITNEKNEIFRSHIFTASEIEIEGIINFFKKVQGR